MPPPFVLPPSWATALSAELEASYLAELHTEPVDDAIAYRRSLRDLVGGGEGAFGIADSYPDGVPGASRARLDAIEHAG